MMKSAARHSGQRLGVVAAAQNSTRQRDDLEVARIRMRHLAPRHIEPLPPMHSVNGGLGVAFTPAECECGKRLAARVMAVQISNADAVGALDKD